jgi:hypothetical protein
LKTNKNGKKTRPFSLNKNPYRISSICIDRNQKLWTLEENRPIVHIYHLSGKEISSFRYNTHDFDLNKSEWHPIPTKQIHFADKLYLLDNWEGILVYSIL